MRTSRPNIRVLAYRTDAEGQRIYEVADGFAAPISVNVVTGENSATVKLKIRWKTH